MPCQTSRLATISGNHVNIHIAGVLAAERDPFSIGREMRIRRLSLKTCETTRSATRARDGPDVLCISEGDLRRAHGWTAQQPRAIRILSVCLDEEFRPGDLHANESDREASD